MAKIMKGYLSKSAERSTGRSTEPTRDLGETVDRPPVDR